jgi:hypothetical protein
MKMRNKNPRLILCEPYKVSWMWSVAVELLLHSIASQKTSFS